MSLTRKTFNANEHFQGMNPPQHWYRDNQMYFITARCRGRFPAFVSDDAKSIFWTQFDKYTAKHGFTPCVTTLLDNHYHTVGYLKKGVELKPMLHGIHGSTAKLVNDILENQLKVGQLELSTPHSQSLLKVNGRLLPFWSEGRLRGYFDGCLRNEKQGVRTYRYVLTQSRRHGICSGPALYPHTRVNVTLDAMLKRARQLNAWLEGVRYRRYEGA